MLKGTPLQYNASTALKYHASLAKQIKNMQELAIKEITKLYKTPDAKVYFAQDGSIASQARILLNSLEDKFADMFSNATEYATTMVDASNTDSQISLLSSLKNLTGGMAIDTKIHSADMHETIKASISTNVNLIKSIPSEYADRLKHIVLKSITTGQGLSDILPSIQSSGDITERRAKNIALDQTRKAFNSINHDRMKKVGIAHFEWIHSGGGLHPRQEHIDLNGQIFSMDKLPIIDRKTGERGIPGQAINCRCTSRPVLMFDNK